MNEMTIERIRESLREIGLWVAGKHLSAPLGLSAPRTDSRKVRKGDIFVCIPGFESDGHAFAPQAVRNGAALLVTERILAGDIPQICVKNTRKAAALLAAMYYDHPAHAFTLIGVTGTNGKTTISWIIETILRRMGLRTGRIGTIGYNIDGVNYPSQRTTPDILELHEIFARMRDQQVDVVVMEVSSHALALDRVYGIRFNAAVFTNLSRDHLDFHGSMAAYRDAKFMLFEQLDPTHGVRVVNTDDPAGEMLSECYPDAVTVSRRDGDCVVSDIETTIAGSSFTLQMNSVKQLIRTNLTGDFNVDNCALAIATIGSLFPTTGLLQISAALADPVRVPGRMEQPAPGVFLDYAHTPDALQKALQTLSGLPHRRLTVVLGAGGDRDPGKRPMMGAIALKLADQVIFTNDNPRHEDPATIIRGLVGNHDPALHWMVQRDRRQAIRTAIALQREGDIVLIAGKGHETTQQIGDQTFHFDDREEILTAVDARESQNDGKIPAVAGQATTPLAFPLDPLWIAMLFGLNDASPENLPDQINTITTDSRKIEKNTLFFALKGERFDGHDFVPEVLKSSDTIAVVHRETGLPRTLLVDDTLKAYGQLASAYARLFTARRIAITGSVGKTTIKEILRNILSLHAPTLCTTGNENNRIGVPRSLFRLRPRHRFAVVETGTNQPGEIDILARIVRPHIAVITSIGPSHLEFLGTIDGVFHEKTGLFRHTRGVCLYPADEPRFKDWSDGIPFGPEAKGAGFYEITDSGELRLGNRLYTLYNSTPQFAVNAGIASVIASVCGCSGDTIAKGLRMPLQVPHRMEIRSWRNGWIIADCYNANPVSMKAAIRFWEEFHPERPHLAVLGDMLELGADSQTYHRQIGEMLSDAQSKNRSVTIWTVGQAAVAYAGNEQFSSVQELIARGGLTLAPAGAVILVKGSHGIHLERILPDQDRE